MNKSKGFTIIELLVVVAIIAVLTGIVLVNVTQYINRGKDASIRGNLSTLLTNAAVIYDENGHFNDFCDNQMAAGKPIYDAISAAYGAGVTIGCNCNTVDCAATATKWCSIVTLKNTNKFCVDSTGNKIESATVTCPATGVCT